MQLRINTATFTNGDPAVAISGVTSGAEAVEVGSELKRDGEQAIYIVASRTPASGASLTEVTLTVPYGGSSGTGLCQIVNDFSPSRSYPLTYKGDGDPADWIRRALTMIDTDMASMIAAFPLAPGAAGSVAYATGTALAWTGAGSAGQSLLSGADGAPTWGTPALATAANGLKSATTTVAVSGAAAPTAGQVLTATSNSAATWQDPTGGFALTNDEYLTGETLAAAVKRLIGVTPTNYLALDRDGLGILAGSGGGLQITSADGTLRANGTGVATGRVLYTNSSAEIIAANNLCNDGTNVSIAWGGAFGIYPLDVNGKSRADRVLVGTAGGYPVHASLGYVINGQSVLRSVYGIQLTGNTYASADASSSNFIAATTYHVVVPLQDASKAGLGIYGATSQTGSLFVCGKSTLAPVFAISASGVASFYGSTSGYVSLQAPAVAGSQAYTLPSGYGTTGQLLTSDGAGGLSWSTVSGGGSGTVNAGSAGDLAYYVGAGTAVSGLTTPAAGQVLTSGAAPAWSASPSLTNLTLSSLSSGGYVVFTDGSKKLVTDASLFWRTASGRLELYHTLNTSTTAGILDITCTNNTGLALHVATNGTTASQYCARFGNAAITRDDLVVMADGKIGIGASYGASTFTQLVNLKNNNYIGGINAAGNGNKKLIGLTSGDLVSLDGSGVGIVAGSSNISLTNGTGNLLATAMDGLYKQGSNGQKLEVKQLTELHTLAAASTSDTTIQIPAGALLIAVDARVTTTVVGPTSWQYGVAVDTARFGSALALTAATTNAGLQDGPRYYPSATSIRFEGAGGAFSAGVIRVTLHYIEVTPATS